MGQTPVELEVLSTFREEYLSALKQRSEGNASVTDKMPQNFQYLGLIARALPEAKIIHVKRSCGSVLGKLHAIFREKLFRVLLQP